ncbi:uncharacterized protein ACB058_018889 isoform 1-T1 [Synchiropus picturatus]
MKFDLDSTLLLLLLLAERMVHCSPLPVSPCASLSTIFNSSVKQLDTLVHMSRELHGLTKEELLDLISEEHHLGSLPVIQHNAAHFQTMKMNESLAQMFVQAHSFRLHVDWLKTVQENYSLPTEAAEGARGPLVQLSRLLTAALQQLKVDPPVTTVPSFPNASTAFDALTFSIEVSERLKVFCRFSKHVLRYFQRTSRCPR